jgi:hypothetical protein
MVQLAVDDMVRLVGDLDAPSLEVTNAVLVLKTIAAQLLLATVEKIFGGGRRLRILRQGEA